MILIRDLVKQTLMTGYLSRTTEEQLRYLLQCTHYGIEDVQAFYQLQRGVLTGSVTQESRSALYSATR
ncbi:hypothetical protein PN466_05150 [Roseofilum reptotaenium CS-1145]|uniref:Uncharacterized protein n=1 Tax=Roseofilum reptotaenium AO1-A TaxID=1925591 RepID=A0A1L9QUX5_9CYAN|nr:MULTISPECIES: hypothetical protein [Roseofilum]MBP0026809.1 hypothetical protein [Roseofilum sp. Guam]MDB9516344.1 hypothetical protein [Roseofilum reptotaenium CS-1145]OJJ26449.1 hypothetical protein BI308_06235 [Roseofilum reptotaenium AO1-A]